MKIGIYFLFYIAMILELLTFIVERDDAVENASSKGRDLDTLAQNLSVEYSRPLILHAHSPSYVQSGPSRGSERGQMKAYVAVSNLWSAAEKDSLELKVIRVKQGVRGSRDSTTLRRGETGRSIGRDSVFIDPGTFGFFYLRHIEGNGNLAFNDTVFVRCETIRQPPPNYPDTLKSMVMQKLGDDAHLGKSMVIRSNLEFINFRSTGTIHKVE
ncbi:MAG: hypothetical protein WB699_14595 [Bacteroidota bacterium]